MLEFRIKLSVKLSVYQVFQNHDWKYTYYISSFEAETIYRRHHSMEPVSSVVNIRHSQVKKYG
jgi:hypothetical protein